MEETLEPGASVARVALRHGVNANQVFQWRRLHREGRLGAERSMEVKLLPVTVSEEAELAPREQAPAEPPGTGAIHVEIPGRALISLEGSVDRALACAVIECLRR